MISVVFASVMAVMLAVFVCDAHAANPNLFVSAENPLFENHFAGSMVVEVIVRHPSNDIDKAQGEPDVTINGQSLRMAQASNGNWYAYFANVDSARAADSTVGSAGGGLDFGVFCSRDTHPSVFGIDLSDTDGFSVPSPSGLSVFADGNERLVECQGSPDGSDMYNNVVRKARLLNTNPGILPGQIGLEPSAWPLIQLFSFSDVIIRYNSGAGVQQSVIEYGDIPNISISLDRESYPQNAEIFLTINDVQLNQDPTDKDSWTFHVGTPGSVFYQAFDTGTSPASGPDDLAPHLSRMGFVDNGMLFINTENILEFKTNSNQQQTFVDGTSGMILPIVTLVEDRPNSGIFHTGDYNHESTISIKADAPRARASAISYNGDSLSVLTGPSSARISLDKPSLTVSGSRPLTPGTEYRLVLTDQDQNLNSGTRDALDAFRSTMVPALRIGNPLTLEDAYNVTFFNDENAGMPAGSSVPDANSSRLFIDTSSIEGSFEKISLNTGTFASDLKSVLIMHSHEAAGTNWINYDFRAIERNLQVRDFSDTAIKVYFDSLDSQPVLIAKPGSMASPQGLVQIDDETVRQIHGRTGQVLVVVDFDGSNDSTGVGFASNKTTIHPIILDFFSFGLDSHTAINNSIYRFELEESDPDSSVFEGTLEFAVANQINILDPTFIQSLRMINDDIKFIITDRLAGADGISISYSDLNNVGIITDTSTKSDARTNSGSVFLDNDTYRFGQPVTVTLRDPDLNIRHDRVDIYNVIDDPLLPNVDTVGNGTDILFEILIKDIRYKRCVIDGKEHGGLAASGFALVETSADSGVFEGIFKMPSQICNKSGTKLVSSAGGGIDAKYHDYLDGSGNMRISSLSRNILATSMHLDADKVTIPLHDTTKEIILSGSIANHARGDPLVIVLARPDGIEQTFATRISSGGTYMAALSFTGDFMPGNYTVRLFHDGMDVGSDSFAVSYYTIPAWIKDIARNWSEPSASDSGFLDGIRYLLDEGILDMSSNMSSDMSLEESVPHWLKDAARWWGSNQINDYEFLNLIQFLMTQGIIRA